MTHDMSHYTSHGTSHDTSYDASYDTTRHDMVSLGCHMTRHMTCLMRLCNVHFYVHSLVELSSKLWISFVKSSLIFMSNFLGCLSRCNIVKASLMSITVTVTLLCFNNSCATANWNWVINSQTQGQTHRHSTSKKVPISD